MNAINTGQSFEVNDPCQIVILSEDGSTQRTAMELCSRLRSRFENDLSFDVHSWSLNELDNPNSTRSATHAAARADVLLIAMQQAGLSPAVQKWLDGISEARSKSEGALAIMVPDLKDSGMSIDTLLVRFKNTATRLRMDFLGVVPLVPEGSPPSETGNSHWGLNE